MKDIDNALIKIAQGDMSALSVVHDGLARLVFSVAFTVTGNAEDSRDVLGDTIIRVAQSAHLYRPGSNARAWVCAIARNLALDLLRKRRREEADGEAVERESCDDETAVWELLSSLGEGDREIVLLRVNLGYSYKEIAALAGTTPEAARKRYKRAIDKLKGDLTK